MAHNPCGLWFTPREAVVSWKNEMVFDIDHTLHNVSPAGSNYETRTNLFEFLLEVAVYAVWVFEGNRGFLPGVAIIVGDSE